jgi:hypothetical protein
MLEDEGAVYRNIILKKMTSVETTLLYLSLSHLQKIELGKAHWSKTKPVYAEVLRNKPPLAYRKLFRYVTYECVKYMTRGERLILRHFEITEFSGVEAIIWNVYEDVEFDCRHFDCHNHPHRSICISTAKTYDPFHDVLESALIKTHDKKKMKYSLQ